jgi:hypothetical protein
MVPPPPELIQKAIQGIMQSLMEMGNNDDGSGPLPPHLAKAFSQIVSNENLRRGIAENLSRAAPALIDPRCQGVMLSVYVPPGPAHPNRGLMPGQYRSKDARGSSGKQTKRQGGQNGSSRSTPPGMGGWLNKILSSSTSSNTKPDIDEEVSGEISDNEDDNDQEDQIDEVTQNAEANSDSESSSASKLDLSEEISKIADKKLKKRDRQARMAAVAAATAMINEHNKSKSPSKTSSSKSNSMTPEQKVQKHLTRLQALCRSIPLKAPSDPVRSRSWTAWTGREKGAIIFRKNRRALNEELFHRRLRINTEIGSKGMGSMLRQMMSVKDVSHEIDEVIKCAVETEAARSQRLQVTLHTDLFYMFNLKYIVLTSLSSYL